METTFPKSTLRSKTFREILHTLEQSIQRLAREPKKNEDYPFIRDSVIQRLEYSIEYARKTLKTLLHEIHGEEGEGPKDVIRKAYKYGYISDLEIRALLIEERNVSSHEYGEPKIEEIIALVPKYFIYLQELDANIQKKLRTSI